MKERTDESCPKCNKIGTSQELIQRMRREYWGKDNGDIEYRYSCDRCGYIFYQPEAEKKYE